MMEFIPADLPGIMVIQPRVFEDERGYFFEKFRKNAFLKAGLPGHFVQDNQSRSVRGVVRGLHYQLAPYSQAKLVHVISGEIWDVAVDLRQDSSTFGKWFGELLNDKNHRHMYIPRGFAHGFAVLSETAVVEYKCDQYYHPASERGIFYNDPALAIDWKLDPTEVIISAKDKRLPLFSEAEMNFLV